MKKRYSRAIGIFALIFAYVLVTGACGGSSTASRDVNSGGSTSNYDSSPQAASGGAYYGAYSESEESYDVEYKLMAADSPMPDFESKIIKNASVEMRAKGDIQQTYSGLMEFASSLGGYETNCRINNYDTYSVVHATIKIPPEKLDAYLKYLKDEDKVNKDSWELVNHSTTSDDITESYYDTRTRLETKRRALERYYELLANANDIETIVFLQRTIDSLTEEIESQEGRLRVWDSQVNMSTVTLYMRWDSDPIEERKEIDWNALTIDDMGYLIRSGFVSISNTVIAVFQWAAILLLAFSPLWAIAGVVIFVWRGRIKKRKAKLAEAASDDVDPES